MSNKGSDKRSVATDALETLGTIIGADQKRDAIHLAVEPVVAGEGLRVGEDITVVNGVAWARAPFLGIVDPFLKRGVKPGERFWFVMYPRQVHSLRHVWTHPAFSDEPEVASPSPFSEISREASEKWLRNYIDSCDLSVYEYEDVLKAAVGDRVQDAEGYYGLSNQGDYMLMSGYSGYGDIPAEFWTHVEVVTGKAVPAAYRATHFSCSC
jgi:hypothetical protein